MVGGGGCSVVGGAFVVVGGLVVVAGGKVLGGVAALQYALLQQLIEHDLREPPRDWFRRSHAWFSIQKKSKIHPLMKMDPFRRISNACSV